MLRAGRLASRSPTQVCCICNGDAAFSQTRMQKEHRSLSTLLKFLCHYLTCKKVPVPL